MTRSIQAIARDLKMFDTSLLSDSIERVHGMGVPAGIRALSSRPRRIAGRAITVEVGPQESESSRIHLGARAIDSAGKGDVIVVANSGRLDTAVWGGLLSTGASIKGVEAVVIDGACRDVEELLDLGVEAFCRGVVPVTARGRYVELSFGEHVTISGVPVDPGDWVVGDATGIVVIPAGRVEDVIAVAVRISRNEDRLRRSILEHRPVADVLADSYESLVEGNQ